MRRSVGKGFVLVVKCKVSLDGCYLGASIAVNGVCLTATRFDESTVAFGIAPETLRKTNLKILKSGEKVNLERAAKMGDRNSGHYVQGHVDGTGEIMSKTMEGESLWIKVKVPKSMINLIVVKGFIAIDGTSLTVCEVNSQEAWFTFMLVQYTQTKIIIPHKNIGDLVNLELDVLGKYVEKSMGALLERIGGVEAEMKDKFEQIMSRLDTLEGRLN
mmetsp:Transcript_32565/g.51852  ORF Transcript_32565/g.51852 Transcript_32565/m.51852 type:complete len:216 (-) Transcript_32565:865-1512(-)